MLECKLKPNSFTQTATSTTNSITLTGSTTDQPKTTANACSGIAKYYFSKDNGASWEPTDGQTGTSYTFSGLNSGSSYSLKMKAKDHAGNEFITGTVSKATAKSINDLKAGEYVNYVDKNGTTRKCVVLYDTAYNRENATDYGVQIITAESVDTVTLGNNDETVVATDFNYVGSAIVDDDCKKAAASYNKAVDTLNNKARTYIDNNGIAINARCVGSSPDFENDTTMFYSSSDSNSYFVKQGWNGLLKDADENYKSDVQQLNYLGLHISYDCWLASRHISVDYNVGAKVRFLDDSGRVCEYMSLFIIWLSGGINYQGSTDSNDLSYGVRPVFALSPNVKIIEGEGTTDNPYVLGL